MEKTPEPSQEPQGFLSIVKINTRSQLDSAQEKIRRKTSINRESNSVSKNDFVVEDLDECQKENTDNSYYQREKGRKLITEKDLIIEKMRQKRRKLE